MQASLDGFGRLQEGGVAGSWIWDIAAANTLGFRVVLGSAVFGATCWWMWKLRVAARAAVRRRTVSGRAL